MRSIRELLTRSDVTDRLEEFKAVIDKDERTYGHSGTFHQTTILDVEVHKGKVVGVWFRYAMVPFQQVDVSKNRAEEMKDGYEVNPPRGMVAIEFDTKAPIVDPPNPGKAMSY